jgi:murein DD-endopeptidase MepM/ murein hydrolase activator NlpD
MTAKILWPLVSNVIRRNKLSNTFGRFPERKSGVHWGWDFYAKAGTPCFAIADGPIKLVYGSATDTGSFGLVVVQEFEFEGKKLYAAYCHLSAAYVATAPHAIAAGSQIGMTGNSGNASTMKGNDEHLHFEIRSSPRPDPGGEPYRLSPLKVFKVCPLTKPILEP